jgi:hypothetical protein
MPLPLIPLPRFLSSNSPSPGFSVPLPLFGFGFGFSLPLSSPSPSPVRFRFLSSPSPSPVRFQFLSFSSPVQFRFLSSPSPSPVSPCSVSVIPFSFPCSVSLGFCHPLPLPAPPSQFSSLSPPTTSTGTWKKKEQGLINSLIWWLIPVLHIASLSLCFHPGYDG